MHSALPLKMSTPMCSTKCSSIMIGTKVRGETSLGKQPHNARLTVVDLFSRHMQQVDMHRLKVLPILVLRGENFPTHHHGTPQTVPVVVALPVAQCHCWKTTSAA